MRRVLRGVAEGEDDLGDVSTLADPSWTISRRPAARASANGKCPQNRGGAFQAPPRPPPAGQVPRGALHKAEPRHERDFLRS